VTVFYTAETRVSFIVVSPVDLKPFCGLLLTQLATSGKGLPTTVPENQSAQFDAETPDSRRDYKPQQRRATGLGNVDGGCGNHTR
jgi:hypothetical protein